MKLKGEETRTTLLRSVASYSPCPACNRSLSNSDVAMRLRSLAQTHQRAWRSSQDFSRSSCIDHARPKTKAVSIIDQPIANYWTTNHIQRHTQVCSMPAYQEGRNPRVHARELDYVVRLPLEGQVSAMDSWTLLI